MLRCRLGLKKVKRVQVQNRYAKDDEWSRMRYSRRYGMSVSSGKRGSDDEEWKLPSYHGRMHVSLEFNFQARRDFSLHT